jgi:multicomponent Na+:H+ antiporter subunit G
MDLVLEVIAWICLLAGGGFVLAGGIGLLRLPDFFTRLHAAGVTDTMGAGLILVGLMFEGGLSQISIKLLLILLFMLFTSPTATHALAKAALHGGLVPLVHRQEEPTSNS